MDVRPNSDSVTGKRFRTAVDPSMGRTHAFDGCPRMVTQGLRGVWTAQRNAAGKTFWAFAILHRPESRWCANPWQTPLVACDEPMLFTLRNLSCDHVHAILGVHEWCSPLATPSAISRPPQATQRDDVASRAQHTSAIASRGVHHQDELVRSVGQPPYRFLGSSKTGRFCRRLQGRIHAIPRNRYGGCLGDQVFDHEWCP
jgi:hypothetical protein